MCAGLAADSAGTMESNSGKANVTPTPRKKVRRGMAFLVKIITLVTSSFEMGCS